MRDGFLINPIVVDARPDITTQLLSDNGYAAVIPTNEDGEAEQTFYQRDFERRFFSELTNRVFCFSSKTRTPRSVDGVVAHDDDEHNEWSLSVSRNCGRRQSQSGGGLTCFHLKRPRLASPVTFREVINGVDFDEVNTACTQWARQDITLEPEAWLAVDGNALGSTVTDDDAASRLGPWGGCVRTHAATCSRWPR